MKKRICRTKNHTIGKNTRSFCVYTVWDNKTDELVILDGEAKECAKAMGIKFSSFYCLVSLTRSGKRKRWSIESRYLDKQE